MSLNLDKTDGVSVKSGIPLGSLINPRDELIWIWDQKGASFDINMRDFCAFVEAFLFGNHYIIRQSAIQEVCEDIQYHCPGKRSVRIPVGDFVPMVQYVFTNSDVMPNDPRVALVNKLLSEDKSLALGPGRAELFEWLSGLEKVPGFNVIFGRDTNRLQCPG